MADMSGMDEMLRTKLAAAFPKLSEGALGDVVRVCQNVIAEVISRSEDAARVAKAQAQPQPPPAAEPVEATE